MRFQHMIILEVDTVNSLIFHSDYLSGRVIMKLFIVVSLTR